MTPIERVQAAIDKLENGKSASTTGPWVRGNRWNVAGVMPKMFGEGNCAYCARFGDPTWVGRRNINGIRMLAHVHAGDVWDERGINAVRDDGPVSVVIDTDEYGSMAIADAELVVTLHATINPLLSTLERWLEYRPLAMEEPIVALADAILGADS